MKNYLLLLFVLPGLATGYCLMAQEGGQDSGAAYQSQLNIVYCQVDGKELKLNAFLPANSTNPAPAIVEIHGGWWYGGNFALTLKGVGGHQAFIRHHLAVFSIQYRLGTDGGFPENIRDCRNAIRFIRQNAKRFNIDPARIDVTGGSAGGHLSLMLAMVPDDFDDGGPTAGLEGVSARVSGSFSYVPPTDFVRFWNQGPEDTVTNGGGRVTFRPPDANIPYDSRPRLRVLFHGVIPDTEAHRDLYEQMSPIGHVQAGLPPLLICDGERDPIVPGLHGKALYERLKAVDADAAYWMTPNGGHAFPGGRGFDKVLDTFLEQSLELEGVSNNPRRHL